MSQMMSAGLDASLLVVKTSGTIATSLQLQWKHPLWVHPLQAFLEESPDNCSMTVSTVFYIIKAFNPVNPKKVV
jgi:hypothetical protein